jgi:hypothetical protein
MTQLGHEDQFLLSRLNDRCQFREATFAGTHGNGQEAPKADHDRRLGSTTDELAMNVIVQSLKDR